MNWVVFSLSSQSDNYTQPKGGYLCKWAIKDSPKYPMTHRITLFHCETPYPEGRTEHSCLDLEGIESGSLETWTQPPPLDIQRRTRPFHRTTAFDKTTSITPMGLQPPFNWDCYCHSDQQGVRLYSVGFKPDFLYSLHLL